MPKTFLIFAGGLALSDATVLAVRKIEQVELVIAADSGLHAAQKLGLMTDVVIGDMDSVDTNALAEAELMIEPAAAGSDDDDAFRFFVGGKQQRRLEIGEIFVSAVANGLSVRRCGAGERGCIH